MKHLAPSRLSAAGRAAAATALLSFAGLAFSTPGARAAGYLPGRVVVAFRVAAGAGAAAAAADGGRRSSTPAGTPAETRAQITSPQVVRLPPGERVGPALARLRRLPDVAYAVPDYVARVADAGWIPDDPGRAHVRGGWEAMQWNFLPGEGVDAPPAWANLIADHRAGAKGVVVAVLDTGVAYRNWRRFRRSPDFAGTRFVWPYDFVDGNAYPLDREGHGTFVAGTIAESANNGFALTGLAYGATIMPVRVLDSDGNGDADTIARGIRWAVHHGAQVINLSLEFTPDVTASDIPEIIDAIRYAYHRGVTVVAAAGNEGVNQLAYPARASEVVSVGATTRDRCLADYSNTGAQLDLVAPGGGDDASLSGDPNCHPERSLPSISQLSFPDPNRPGVFGYPPDMFGTSMSTPHVAAAAAMVIASGVIGAHPTPDQIRARLESTAQPLGSGDPNADYGYGLLDIGAATARPASGAGSSSTRSA